MDGPKSSCALERRTDMRMLIQLLVFAAAGVLLMFAVTQVE
jgi:hypothetical protein